MAGARILRTPDAIADLDAIWDFIARDNVPAADRLLDRLQAHFELLVKHPEIGEQQPGLADGSYRRFTCGSYVIYYRPIDDGIVVIRVLHGARDVDALL
jgi:toxin ParE1/3/4